MFWPPRLPSRLPPTKATSARPQAAPSSPSVSTRMIASSGLTLPGWTVVRRTYGRPEVGEQPRDLVEAFGMSRHQDESQAWIPKLASPAVDVHGQRFLRVLRATGHPDERIWRQTQQQPQFAACVGSARSIWTPSNLMLPVVSTCAAPSNR